MTIKTFLHHLTSTSTFGASSLQGVYSAWLRLALHRKSVLRPVQLPDSAWRVLAILFVFFLPAPASADMPVRQLRISSHTLSVEVAHTQATRSQGLMFRQSLGENDGMLFVFSEPERYSMWMMNTDIPLSVAFLDEGGTILNIADMLPRTATAHHSAGASKYAVEMNLGWFAARNIKPGERVIGLDKVPAAQ